MARRRGTPWFFAIAILAMSCACANKTDQDDARTFTATDEWQDIKEGQTVPSGLHYRINMETGRKEAKLIGEAQNTADSQSAIVKVKNETEEEEAPVPLTDAQIKEMQKKLAKTKVNKDIELIKLLMENYANSTDDKKVLILEDLEYYMHQIGGAIDFIFLNGLNVIALPALKDENVKILELGAKLVGSASQNNKVVQEAVVQHGVLKQAVELLPLINKRDYSTKDEDTVKRRIVFLFSAVLRGNSEALQTFADLGGFATVFDYVITTSDVELKLKGLRFVGEMLRQNYVLVLNQIGDSRGDPIKWCSNIVKDKKLFEPDEKSSDLTIDRIDSLSEVARNFWAACAGYFAMDKRTDAMVTWLKHADSMLSKELEEDKEDPFDFQKILKRIVKLQNDLKQTRKNLDELEGWTGHGEPNERPVLIKGEL